MTKKSLTIAFKKEVLDYIQSGNSCYKAAKHFSQRDKCVYCPSMFRQWCKNRESIRSQSNTMKRIKGGGRKTSMGELEDRILSEVIELRLMKIKVTRTFISDRAISLGEENNISIKGSGRWVDGFMKRNGLSLRRTTNLTTLSDDILVERAVCYMTYLHELKSSINLSKTLLMDETSVFFEDIRTQTVDIKGRRHVVMRSTGFASMRITAAISVWANGKKAIPLIIHKGKDSKDIRKQNGILETSQSKAWITQDIIINWIDLMFPRVDLSPGKCIIWDSCRAHISKAVKEHCQKREILMVVIPGGLTPYLQAGDIGIFKEFKDLVSSHINYWKNSSDVQYTKKGNPRPPGIPIINGWIKYSWDSVSLENISNSINAAGFSSNSNEWHISKHDVYGEMFNQKYLLTKFSTLNVDSITGDEESDVFQLENE